ncbi:MAG: DUF1194 domain-containing protein [Pseudomonadota bacterium]
MIVAARSRLVLITAILFSVCALASPLTAKQAVDLELVLAVDISLSMDADEQRLQRDGYVAALRHPDVVRAIKSGPQGKIALTYMEWAGHIIQSVLVPWHVIETADDASAFADKLAAQPLSRALMTSISGAIFEGQKLFAKSNVESLRRVIDVSGDGPNNSGTTAMRARDAAVKAGIVINGLALVLKRPDGPYSYFDIPNLDHYYADCVIGGPGSFVLAVTDKSEFTTAIRQKMIKEIADLRTKPVTPPRTPQVKLLHRAQLRLPPPSPKRAKYDCLIGEKLWEQYQRDQW